MRSVLQISVWFLVLGTLQAQICQSVEITDINGATETVIDCDTAGENECLTLTVDYPTVLGTESYAVESVAYEPALGFTQGTPLNATFDDEFTSAINLGFDFCFYEQTFDQVVIGSNGVITFDTASANTSCPATIPTDNPSPSLVRNAIYGVQHDLVFGENDNADIYYTTIGEAPCRTFVVTYYNARHFGCNERSTTQIALHEFTNEIEIFVENKPTSCETGRSPRALLGIMNQDGTQGVSPADRNSGNWAANQEAWRFVPSGNEMISVTWRADGQTLGTGNQLEVCVTENRTYTAEVTYFNCNAATTFTDDFVVQIAEDFPIANPITIPLCDGDSDGEEQVDLNNYQDQMSVNPVGNFNFSYHSSLNEAETGAYPISNIQNVSSNDVVYVRIQNVSDASCFDVAPVAFNIGAGVLLTNQVAWCDNESANNESGLEEDFPLNNFEFLLFGDAVYQDIFYYATEQDANGDTNRITQMDLTQGSTFYVRMVVNDSCEEVYGPITVGLLPAPSINQPLSRDITLCDINWDDDEEFDWIQEFGSLVTNDTNVQNITFHSSLQAALNGGPLIANSVRDGEYQVYFRVTSDSGCFSIGTINMNVTFEGVEANAATRNICYDGTESVTINLADIAADMLVNPAWNQVSVSYHQTATDAEDDVNAISNTQIVDTPNQSFFVRFEDSNGCYTVRRITIRLIHPTPQVTQIDICDLGNDGVQTRNLSGFNAAIASSGISVAYFATEANALNNQSPLNNFDFDGNNVLYVRLTQFDCVEVYPITFTLIASPEVNDYAVTIEDICDNNGDGQELYDITQFENQIYTGNDNVQFAYFRNFTPDTFQLTGNIANPQNYIASQNNEVYVRVRYVDTGCFSVATLQISFDFFPTIAVQPAEQFVCDFEFDLNEEFNLMESAEDLFVAEDSPNVDFADLAFTFYLTEENANNAQSPISAYYTPQISETTVYARIESTVLGCYSVAPIMLNVIAPPKAVAATFEVCDGNLNGMYDLNLTNLNEIVVDPGTDLSNLTFSYHLTQQDAINEVNSLDQAMLYEANPFPTTLWVRIENIEDCFDVNQVTITFGEIFEIEQNAFTLEACDGNNDGFASFDLTTFENDISLLASGYIYYPSEEDMQNDTNEITNPLQYTNAENTQQTIYVRVDAPGYCPTYATIDLQVIPSPEVVVEDAQFCPGGTVTITAVVAQAGVDFGYEWYAPNGDFITDAPELVVGEEGTYSLLIIGENGCVTESMFEVTAFEVPEITDIVENGNNITVEATGADGVILYSMDGVNWQSNPTFYDLPPGVHYFFVRYEQRDCLGIAQPGIIFEFYNVITPNQDGSNEEIVLNGLEVFGEEKCQIRIFDRYGKKVFEQFSNTSIRWDGTYAGRKLPTTSYYYLFNTPDGREFSGWVTIKNY